MMTKESLDKQNLQNTFIEFTQMSERLMESYGILEQQIHQLHNELALASEQRLQELAEKERLANRLQKLFDALPSGVVVLDETGRVKECNPVAEDLLGAGLIGKTWVNIIEQAFAPRVDDGCEISLCDGRRVSVATRSLEPESGQLLLLTDLTQTRMLQEMVNRQQRLSEMGKMMAQLAHQIRTPLSTAMIYASHLSEQTITEEKRSEFTLKLLRRLQHIEHQIKDMLLFAKGGQSQTTLVAIPELIQSLHQAIEVQLAQADASFTIENYAGDAWLLCQQDSLIGALQNVVNNALQACGQFAKLRFISRFVEENLIDLIISDNGPGMSEEVQKQVLEPFFTTRSQGVGLGLAVVQLVAKAHQGSLWIESKLGSGTSIGLRLPVQQNFAKGKTL